MAAATGTRPARNEGPLSPPRAHDPVKDLLDELAGLPVLRHALATASPAWPGVVFHPCEGACAHPGH